jgi:hypothetical protein
MWYYSSVIRVLRAVITKEKHHGRILHACVS